MSFLDLFSGSGAQKNAASQQQFLSQQTQQLMQMLQGTQGQASSMLGGALGGQLGALTQGTQGALDIMGAQLPEAAGWLGTGMQGAEDQYKAASSLYSPYAQGGQQAWTSYLNALGINGPEGSAAARGMFQASPGYEWQRDQAADLAMRKQGAMGALGSGNTVDAVTRLGSNLANQDWGNWLTRLQGAGSTGMAATGAQAGLEKGIGDLWSGYGGAMAGLNSGYGKDIANLLTGSGTAQAGAIGGNMSQQIAAMLGLTGQQTDALKTQTAGMLGLQQKAFEGQQKADSMQLSGLLGLGQLALTPMFGGMSALSMFGNPMGIGSIGRG